MSSKTKITRAAFLYFEGERTDKFAQCATCALMTPDGYCSILGLKIDNPEEETCGLYVQGPQLAEFCDELVEPEVADYVETKVQCQRCRYGGKTCGLFELLNGTLPDHFDLDTKIRPNGCCNAWVSK